MKIDWFVEHGTGDRRHCDHLCTTEGELPDKQATVYFHDKKLQQSVYLVVNAYSSVALYELALDDVTFPEGLTAADARLEFVHEWVRQHFDGFVYQLLPEQRAVSYSVQRGEVTLRLRPRPRRRRS